MNLLEMSYDDINSMRIKTLWSKLRKFFYFSSFSMFIQSRISKSIVTCSFCSFLFFSPDYLFHPTLFYSFFDSLFCFLPVYSLYFLIPLIVFFSNLLSFFFSFPITLFCLLLPYALFLFNLFSFY